MRPIFRIESLLSARLFIAPQRVGNRLYFISNLSGHLSLYAMDARDGGSVPEPLLPPDIALMTPELMDGQAFAVFPARGQILVMLDRDGDEAYQPMFIPLDGGYPQPAFDEHFAQSRVRLLHADEGRGIVYLHAEPRDGTGSATWQCNLITGGLVKLGESQWGSYLGGVNAGHTKAVLIDGYTVGDHVLYLWTKDRGERALLYGTPLEARGEGQAVALNAIGACFFTPRDRGLLFITALFSDAYGLGYFTLDNPGDVKPVRVTGLKHKGVGELVGLEHLKGNRYAVKYNIDGCSWLYEGDFDERALKLTLDTVVCGKGETAGGVLESSHYDKASNRFALSFSTATTPTQLFTVNKARTTQHTRERVLGIPANWLSKGEDASFASHDGLRVSARLYLPAKALNYEGPRPLVYYIHGGPQGQERPDFAWFSMPIIQFLALNGFAVFVPNVRGSTGYGLSYTKRVDRDWGGQDRLDHVHAMTQVLPKDKRLDARRAGVVGRSYGGYMTLTLAARHPELWSAAVDMFGPYDLFTFMERIPDAWKPYFSIAIGDPVKDRDLLVERSPRTHIDQIACPLLVIQGKNDPRVVERESRDVVEQLQAKGKQVDYLMFEDEGHDVLKFANRVRCYTAITDFFKEHLRP
jgi:pimeloyl-ACP methyl ester carboxylesterase